METLIILGKYIIATGLLLLFYWGVLRHRASYRLCRNYLTGIPALGLLMCIVSFEVPMQMPRSIEQKMEKIEEHFTPWDDAATNDVPLAEIETTAPSANATEEIPSAMKPALEASETAVAPAVHTDNSMTFDDWAILLLIAVSGLLLLLFVYYIAHVLAIKERLSHEQTKEGYNLVRSKSVNTPFSFGKTIFLPSDLDQRSEDLIIRHEMAHIAHRHYLEVWHIEFWTRLCWFNPVMWLCRTELRNVHEFEADRDVICQGADIHTYQTTLLEMVMNESCPAVNGFNHSFIRQRFIEMKSSTAGTLGRFGKVSLLLWIAILFGSFTLRPASSITETEWKMPTYPDPLPFVINGTLNEDSTETCFYLYMADSLFNIEEDKPDAVIPVVNGKIYYQTLLSQVTAGRLRGIGHDGKPTGCCFEIFFIPGETADGLVDNSFQTRNNWKKTTSKAIRRAVTAFRHTHESVPPQAVHWEGKIWERVKNDDTFYRDVQSVCFSPDRTIIKCFSRSNWSVQPFLEDPQGNRYKYLGTYPEEAHQSYVENSIYGYYEFYEPMPSDVEYFKIAAKGRNDSDYYYINEIKIYDKKKVKPNFELAIKATPGIPDCAYIIEYVSDNFLVSNELVAELPIDQNRRCTFTAHLDSIVMAEVTAIFPDGTVCMSDDVLPLVPGEKVELDVYHAYWQVIGGKSSFYKDWSDAKDACDNLRKRRISDEKRDSLQLDYLNQHLDRLGCLYYY